MSNDYDSKYDFLTGLLKAFALPTAVDEDIHFTFDTAHPKFNLLKSSYPIKTIAGNGDNFSKSKNLLHWVSNHMYHKGDYSGNIPRNSIDLLNHSFEKGSENGVNCVCLATILTECLLAIGLKATTVFIMPCSPYDGDNHCVTQVYIENTNKWVMFDPTLNAFFTNEKGECLSLLELRNHFANQEHVFFNEEAKYNDNEWTAESAKENMLYFAKNLFYFQMSENSTFEASNTPNNRFVTLSPQGYDPKHTRLSNIEYRIKKWGDNPNMQNWIENAKKEKMFYSSSCTFEKSPIISE